MTEQEQRIAIAEVCGWVHDGSVTPAPRGQPVFREWWQSPRAERAHSADDLPDYLHDLNAMHEAEPFVMNRVVQGENTYDYILGIVCAKEPIWHATAAQRAEAFLRTIGRWRDK